MHQKEQKVSAYSKRKGPIEVHIGLLETGSVGYAPMRQVGVGRSINTFRIEDYDR